MAKRRDYFFLEIRKVQAAESARQMVFSVLSPVKNQVWLITLENVCGGDSLFTLISG